MGKPGIALLEKSSSSQVGSNRIGASASDDDDWFQYKTVVAVNIAVSKYENTQFDNMERALLDAHVAKMNFLRLGVD